VLGERAEQRAQQQQSQLSTKHVQQTILVPFRSNKKKDRKTSSELTFILIAKQHSQAMAPNVTAYAFGAGACIKPTTERTHCTYQTKKQTRHSQKAGRRTYMSKTQHADQGSHHNTTC
jgi:delta-aminolevulinic acid dehydratase/porphobilinogen synthase